MSDERPCNQIRALLFDHQGHELSELESADVDTHLGSCPSCREFALKTGEMITTARNAASETWSPLDPDSLFARISQGIETGVAQDVPTLADELFHTARAASAQDLASIDPDALFEGIVEGTTPSNARKMRGGHVLRGVSQTSVHGGKGGFGRYRRAWALVAAVACAVVLVWWGAAPDSNIESSIIESERGVRSLAEAGSFIEPPQSEAMSVDGQAPLESLPELSEVDSTQEGVRVFASRNARYETLIGEKHDKIELEVGTVVVELLPGTTSKLSVETSGYSVDVLGTVFYVSAGEETLEVGVFDGVVEVAGPDGSSIRLRDGEVLTLHLLGETASHELSGRMYDELESYVDLVAHRQALSAPEVASSVAPVTDAPVEERVARVDETPEPISVRSLREAALEAQHGGEYRRATVLLDQALTSTAPGDPAGADILLELAQLHLNRLGEEERAVEYLELFIEGWPEDPTVGAIRSQLCRLRDGPDCL